MTSREKTSDRSRAAPPPTLSRTLAIVAVAVLLAIAVGAIVVAAWRGRSQHGDAIAIQAQAASAASRSKHYPGDPYNIAFAGDGDQLSTDAVDQIREMAESAKNETTAIVLSGKIESGNDRAARMALTKKRINAVSRALISYGVAPGRLRVEVAEYPVGRIPPREADVVEMTVR